MLIQQRCDLHVRICIDILRERTDLAFVYVCVASLLSVLLTVKRVGYLVPIRAEVIMEFTHAHTRTINLYSIRGKCHMIAESAQPRHPA